MKTQLLRTATLSRSIVLRMTLVLAGCAADPGRNASKSDGGAAPGYHVTIRDTSYGVPHVRADDVPSAVAGLGYVGARDYGCILLEQIVRIRGERSMYFGPGAEGENVDSDFGMLALGIRDGGSRGLQQQTEEIRRMYDGYVAGFNYYLAHQTLAAECDGKAWAKPLVPNDLFAYHYWLAQLASGDPLLSFVATAAPPSGDGQTSTQSFQRDVPGLQPRSIASNGWAIGRDRTETGHGMLLANPHFPWEGPHRFYESHITVPGVLDVYGASLIGSIGITIGFNENVAWTHTVSAAHHFTLYQLDLAASDPTTYLYDGKPVAMTATDFSIAVLGTDGSLSTEHRRMYSSHYGPMLNIPGLGGWTTTTAFTFRNANEDNFAGAEQWYRMNRATSLDDLKNANEEVHGIAYLNTVAVDAAGTTLYMDASRTPNLSDAALADYRDALSNDPVTRAVDAQGAMLLNGSSAKFEWQDAGANPPGIVPFSKSPSLQRTDFVFNSNDSCWLTNPAAPLTGYAPVFGAERTARTPRTRMNMLLLTEQAKDGVSGADGKFSFDELSEVQFSDRTSLTEVLLDQVLARCEGATTVKLDGKTVDISGACEVLGAWDRRSHLNSVGAVLFREFLGAFSGAVSDKGALFDDAFDPDAPIATPHILKSAPPNADDPVLAAIGRAVTLLESAGYKPSASISDMQHVTKGQEVIPIHGATNLEGAFNVVDFNEDSGSLLASSARGPVVKDGTGTSDVTGLTEGGYPVNDGSSFMMVLEFTDGGPHAQAVLSHSESNDPASPHFADQTHLFSKSNYRRVLFSEKDIMADPNLAVNELFIP